MSPVTAQTTPPTITAHPSRLNLGSSDAVVLQSSASADASQFQWYRGNPGDTTQPLAGATGPLLVQPPLAADTSFWVRVSNSAGSVDSTGLIVARSAPATSQILFSAGSSSSGQLGLGSADANPHSTPAQVTTSVTQISAGGSHSLFLKANGSLWAMGANNYGQLGDGSTTQRNAPVQIATGVALVSAGNDFSLFVKTDGSLWAMGRNNYGQLGDGSTTDRSTPVQIATGVAQVAAGFGHALFLKTDATLWAAGLNSLAQLGDGTTINRATPVQIATGVAQISAGRAHSFFLKSDGSLWAMGTNNYGQLGDGSTMDRSTPVQISTGVAHVSAGHWHSLFVRADGSLWGMGRNQSGQLGDGSIVDRSTPVQIASEVSEASAGQDFGQFRKSDHSLWAMGLNTSGQLGDRTIINRVAPVFVAENVTAFSAGGAHRLYSSPSYTVTFLLGASGTHGGGGALTQAVAPGASATAPIVIPAAGLELDGWDATFGAVTGNIVVTARYRDVPVAPVILAQPVRINAGDGSTLHVQVSGNYLAYQWYRGNSGDTSQPVPDATGALLVLSALTENTTFWVRISNSAGFANSDSLMVEKSVAPIALALSAWGFSSNGQLALGTAESVLNPSLIATGVIQIATGAAHSVFIKSDSSLWGMGDNSSGQLRGIPGNRLTPALISEDVSQVAAGYSHNLYIKSDHSLWGIGANGYGQLGHANRYGSSVPYMAATGVARVFAGVDCSFFIKTDGSLWAMGRNSEGQLGNGSNNTPGAPVKIATDVVQVAAGGTHTLFLKVNGSLWGTGSGALGQLGDGNGNRSSPVQIASGILQAAAGQNHSLFIKSDGSLWAMGQNQYGQLGDGTTLQRNYPVQIASDVTHVAAGSAHSLFIKSDGSLWAMGFNSLGSLGDGTTTHRTTPVRISPSVRQVSTARYHSLSLVLAHTVIFDLGAQGTHAGGGALEQLVSDRTNATPPLVTSTAGWVFVGWDSSLSSIDDDLVIKARYGREQSIAFAALPDRIYATAPFLLDASASSGLPVAFSVVSGPASFGSDGKTLTLTGVGSVSIRAAQPGNSEFAPAAPVDRTFSVSQAAQTIDFAPPSDRTFGAAPVLLEASASSGLPVTFAVVSGPATLGTDGRTLTLTGAGSVTLRAAQPGNANFTAASPVDRTFNVGQASQTIAFASLPSRTFGAAPFTLSASASSGLSVAFSVISGPATLGFDGRTLTLTGAGPVVIRASQAGNANYTAATPVERTFSVGKASQTISFAALYEHSYGDTFVISASSSSGLPLDLSVVAGPASITPFGTLTLTGVGSVTIRASQPGDANYAAASPVERTFNVVQDDQRITKVTQLSDRSFGSAPIALFGSASSGLPVVFSVVSGPASINSNGLLTLTGAGSVIVRASQEGNANYAPAAPFDQWFEVSQSFQHVTLAWFPDPVFGDAPFALSASSSSGLPVAITVVSGPASIGPDGRTLTLTGAGSVTLRASQAGDANYVADAAERTFHVGQASQTITFASLPGRTFGDAPFLLSASASSGLPVVFSVVSGPATLGPDGVTLTLTAPGSVTVRASQAGNTHFTPASDVEHTFSVSQTPQTIDFAALPARIFGDAPFTLSAAASSGFPVVFSVVSGPATLGADGRTLTLTGAGPVTIRASLPGDDDFAPATPVEQSFLVNQAAQTIAFAPLSNLTFGDAPILLEASASSGLPVVFSVVSGPATLGADARTLTLTGAGSVVVRAVQAGDADFAAATPVDRAFEVSPSPTATLTLPALTTVTYNGTPQAALATTTPAGLHVVYAYKSGSAPATATPPTLPGSYTVTATLEDPLRTTAQPRPATGKLNIHPATPALPTSLARTVAGTVDLDLAGANPATGVTYQAKSLPSGLKLDSRTGRLTGAVTAKPGAYSFSVWALAASLKSEIRTCTLTVGSLPLAWTGAFEGLIRSDFGDSLPVGKLQLITTATGSFTGSLVTPQPKTFAIKGAWRVAPDGQSATALVNTASYVLSLSWSADSEAPAGTLMQVAPGTIALLGRLDEPVRLASFTGAGTSLAPWRGSYLVTATTLADLNLDPAEPARPLPAGTGTATLTIAPKGTLSAKGKLADGSPWTASLETDPNGGYRWFTQPYATPGNYFSSETRFTPLADFPSLYQAGPATDFFWHKPAAPKDKLFPAGFGPVLARVAISPAKAPLAGKFTVPFSGNEHLGDGLQIATDLKTTSRAFTLSRTAAESYVLDYTKPARLAVPLVVDGDTLRTTARPTVIGRTRLLDLLVISDGSNHACVQIGLGAGGPADLSLGVACWTGSTLKLTPALLAGSYTLHGHADTDLLDTATGFAPAETSLAITPADAGRVRITLPGMGEILATVSGSGATALNLPQTLGTTRLHAFKIVSDTQGRLALYTVATDAADPTRVSVSILTGARD